MTLKTTACVYKLDVVPTFGEQHLLAQRGAELSLLPEDGKIEEGKLYLYMSDNQLGYIMKDGKEPKKKGILEDISVGEKGLTEEFLLENRAKILEAAAEKDLTTCDVMSLCEEATVAQVTANPFQHESTIFARVGELAKKGIEILHTKKGEPSSVEKTKKEARMARVLNRSSGIDRLSFIKYVKEAIKNLAIKLSKDVAKIYAESQSEPRLGSVNGFV